MKKEYINTHKRYRSNCVVEKKFFQIQTEEPKIKPLFQLDKTFKNGINGIKDNDDFIFISF